MVSRFHIKVKQALEIIRGYSFELPLHHYLKQYFMSNRNMGSQDRRTLRALVYAWYRLGNFFKDLPDEKRMAIAISLSLTDETIEHVVYTRHFNVEDILKEKNVMRKTDLLHLKFPDVNLTDRFHGIQLSEGLNSDAYHHHYFIQPLTWIRCRAASMDKVKRELQDKNIGFISTDLSLFALGIEPAVNLTDLNTFKAGYFEVQDLASQLTGTFFKPLEGEKWYDCCAASGGKSLLLLDQMPDIELTVSDSRSTMLENLSERFKKSGFKFHKSFITDLTRGYIPIEERTMDVVLLDAPCSGSGTWHRNPEQSLIFNKDHLNKYTSLQQAIIKKVAPLVKTGGRLIYITCSVFAMENEYHHELLEHSGFTKSVIQILQYDHLKADDMFIAVYIRT